MAPAQPLHIVVDTAHARCHLPLVIDPCQEKCPHGCLYCYARGLTGDPFEAKDINGIARLFQEAFERRADAPWHKLLRKRIPIRVGFANEPLPPLESGNEFTLRLMEIFNRFDYPYLIISKSALLAEPPYREMISPKNATVHISITTLDPELAALVEPHAPPPELRLETIRRLCAAGVWTVARLDPLIGKIRKGDALLPYFSLALLRAAQRHQARGLLVGLLAPPSRRLEADAASGDITFPGDAAGDRVLLQDIRDCCRQMRLPCSFCRLGSPWRELDDIEALFPHDANCCQLNPRVLPGTLTLDERIRLAPLSGIKKAELRLFNFLADRLR
jgi:hypothetical protein